MKSFIIFNGISTDSFPGVAVSVMPSHKRGAMRYTEFYVVNRDGALHTFQGLTNIELTAKLVLLDARAETRYQINAWASGTGKLILSDDPTKAYKASVLREVKWDRVPGNKGFFDTATINFDCEPFLYEAQDSTAVFTQDGALNNPGTMNAIPFITVEADGDATFSIAGQEITIAGMEEGVPVYLDCENGYVFADDGAMTMTGNFPELPLGISEIVLGENVTKITIAPHWRWV